MEITEEIKKALKDNRLTIGYRSTLKAVRKNLVKRVVIAKNAPDRIRKEISSIKDIELINVEEDSEMLAIMCGKPFTVSMVGFLEKL
ncbi:MAG: ribosomal L7Ae/L30e/S12e/Gadd45 family protein [Candidatus Rehaiarchaeum fermentans]|nr:ribosomal L7Ae/L30e/S12e/Gadd45 family protein [Candidatus Rehaiarchaeum fermentans]